MKNAGYSATPLLRKLGIKEDMIIRLINEPFNYMQLLHKLPAGVVIDKEAVSKKDVIHLFIKRETELSELLMPLSKEIKQNGCIWVSWPKKSGSILSDLSEDSIRAQALMLGLVDIKVCAIDEDWSALKLVIPVKNRKS